MVVLTMEKSTGGEMDGLKRLRGQWVRNSVGSQPEIHNWSLYMEGKEKTKKKAGHFRLEGGRFNKPGLSWAPEDR